MDDKTFQKIERTTKALKRAEDMDCPALADLCRAEITKLVFEGSNR